MKIFNGIFNFTTIRNFNSNRFNYLLSKGVIPPGKHELGFHELSWSIADFDDAIEYLKDLKDKEGIEHKMYKVQTTAGFGYETV